MGCGAQNRGREGENQFFFFRSRFRREFFVVTFLCALLRNAIVHMIEPNATIKFAVNQMQMTPEVFIYTRIIQCFFVKRFFFIRFT